MAMTAFASSMLYWALPLILILVALSGLFLWKGRGWAARFMHRGKRPAAPQSCLDVLKLLGLEGKTLKDDQQKVYAIDFSYRQVCFILELEKSQEGDEVTLIVPNLHQGYLRDMDQILFCLNRFNCHPRLLGRAIVALIRDENMKDEQGRPDLDVRILEPLHLRGDARKDAKYLKDLLESLMTSVLWLLSLLDRMLCARQEMEKTQEDAADEGEQRRLQEVLDFLNPTHLPS